mgnify:CR=1 FL=1
MLICIESRRVWKIEIVCTLHATFFSWNTMDLGFQSIFIFWMPPYAPSIAIRNNTGYCLTIIIIKILVSFYPFWVFFSQFLVNFESILSQFWVFFESFLSLFWVKLSLLWVYFSPFWVYFEFILSPFLSTLGLFQSIFSLILVYF